MTCKVGVTFPPSYCCSGSGHAPSTVIKDFADLSTSDVVAIGLAAQGPCNAFHHLRLAWLVGASGQGLKSLST
jgi:hypothetical protein